MKREQTSHMVTWFLLLILVAGCEKEPDPLCTPPCANGFVCSGDGVCQSEVLPRFDKSLPGRAAQVEILADQVFFASIEPEQRHVLVGQLRPDGQDVYVIGSAPRTRDQWGLSMDAKAGLVGLAWLDESGRFRVARHLDSEPADVWALQAIEASRPYQATRDFAFQVDPNGGGHLFFRDGDGALSLLSTEDWKEWRLEVVDNGESGRALDCDGARAFGVGWDVDAHVGEAMWAAYVDRDCGTLMVAKRAPEGWLIDGVASGLPGSSMPLDGTSLRFPSLAIDRGGTLSLAYQDAEQGTLRYRVVGQSLSEPQTADPGFEIDAFSQRRKDWVGAYASLAFDAENHPSIVYMNATTGELREAQRNGSSALWSQQTKGQGGVTGFYADQDFAEPVGRVIVAERLVVRDLRIRSELVLVWER